MIKTESYRVSKETIFWVNRLKGILQRELGENFTFDKTVKYSVSMIEWMWSHDRKMTKLYLDKYINTITTKYAKDKEWELPTIHNDFRESPAFIPLNEFCPKCKKLLSFERYCLDKNCENSIFKKKETVE